MSKSRTSHVIATLGLVAATALPLACDDASKPKSGAAAKKDATKFDADAKQPDANTSDATQPDSKRSDAKRPDAKQPDSANAPGDEPDTATLEPLPALDTASAAKAASAVASAAAESQGALAAAALAELELARLGASYCAGLSAMAQATADKRGVLVAQAVKDNMPMLDLACEADAAKTMRSLATRDVTTRKSALWDACQFEKLGLMTKADGVELDAVAVLLTHMAFAKLQAHGPVDASERSLLLNLAKTKQP